LNWRISANVKRAEEGDRVKLATIRINGTEQAAIASEDGFVPVSSINGAENRNWPVRCFDLLQSGEWESLRQWLAEEGAGKLLGLPSIPAEEADCAPLYRQPRKIWGIGINYVASAEELKTMPPGSEPVSFMKPDTTMIGPGDPICLPPQSGEVTAEAELAIVIGKTCKNISEAEAPGVVAGFAAALDMTAADIHAQNPRFLTRAKSFDTFFSFGPELITADEIPDLSDLTVETALNGEVRHRNRIGNMRYHPWFIVSFHSRVMTLLPGDIILTGTPGAVTVRDGDLAECRISGFASLINPVKG